MKMRKIKHFNNQSAKKFRKKQKIMKNRKKNKFKMI